MPKCPTCGNDFSNEAGVKSHHKQVHGESLVSKSVSICEVCGEEFEHYDSEVGKFCSIGCKNGSYSEQMSGSNNPSWSDAKQLCICDNCGEQFERYQSKIDRSENNYCSYQCKSEDQLGEMTGSDNPAWEGGEVTNRRGGNWSRIAELIANEDGECAICGVKNELYKDKHGRRLDVHHIVPRRMFDDAREAHMSENLITLCRQCHMGVENDKVSCPEPPDRNL